jgi:ribonuclease Z
VQVVYQENGIKITAFPAIHAIDGSVSYRLDWNGLSFVFSSGSYPNKWFAEQAKDADLVVHERFIAVPDLVAKYGLTPEAALQVGTQVHTAPEAFGKIVNLAQDYVIWNVTKDGIRERMAVINHHSWNPPAAFPPEPVKAEDRVAFAGDRSRALRRGRCNRADL